MILTGVLRHYLSTLLQTTPKRQLLPKLREQRYLMHTQQLRGNNAQISASSFNARKAAFRDAVEAGKYLADPEARGKGRPNPMSDPAMMEGMMGNGYAPDAAREVLRWARQTVAKDCLIVFPDETDRSSTRLAE